MMTDIILHRMIIESQLNGYASQHFNISMDELSKHMFLDEEGNSKEFKWVNRENLSQSYMKILSWERELLEIEEAIMDEVGHL